MESSIFVDLDGASWARVQIYSQMKSCEGVCPWMYFDLDPQNPRHFWSKKLELLIGVRFQLEDGMHHGWLKFSRPDTELTTGFDFVASDWNPIPGEPIGAGLPPVIPLGQEITAEGKLRLTWSPAVAHWQLEFSDELRPAGVWSPVLEARGNEALLELPEQNRFYRLHQP